MAKTPVESSQKQGSSGNLDALSVQAQRAHKEIQEHLRVPLVVNDSSATNYRWDQDQKWGLVLLQNILDKAATSQQRIAVGILDSRGESSSVLLMSRLWGSDNPIKAPTVLAPLLKADVLDVREQLRFEWARAALKREQSRFSMRTYSQSRPFQAKPAAQPEVQPDPPSWARTFETSDAQVLGYWLLGENTGLSAAVSREVIKRWAPVLARQYPQDTPALLKGALDVAAEEWSTVALPKASSPSPFTPEQKDLHFLLGVCDKIVSSVEKALAGAGHPVKRAALVPESLKALQDAFEAKAQKMLERERAVQETGAENETSEEVPVVEKSHVQQRVENGRFAMTKLAIEHLDFMALEWISQHNEDKGDWIGVAENGSRLLTLLASQMKTKQKTQGERDIDQRLGCQILDFMLSKGLNLLEEASASHLTTDNPFLRLSDLCNDETGAWSVAITRATLRHMRDAGLELSDAEAFFTEALATKSHRPLQRQAFESVAQAGLQRWQLDAELEASAKEKREKALAAGQAVGGGSDGEAQSGSGVSEGNAGVSSDQEAAAVDAPKPPMRRRARL